MTKQEHQVNLQGVKSWFKSLEKGTPEAIEAVKRAMDMYIKNMEEMLYCENCQEMHSKEDMADDRFCKLCVAYFDFQDEAWRATAADWQPPF